MWGTNGSGDGQFDQPVGIAVDFSGNVYIADKNNNRIQKFSSSGIFLSKWGINGSGYGQFSLPNGVAIDYSGNVYVTDLNNNRIQIFSNSGYLLTLWGTNGSGDGQFAGEFGLAVDIWGNVFVADQGNHRIQLFGIPLPPSVITNPANNVTSISATLNGNLTSTGTTSAVNVSFEYGLTTSYGNTTPVQVMNTTGLFNAGVTGLTPNTLYHFRAKADGGPSATVYGSDLIFATPPQFLLKWGTYGSGNGQFHATTDVAVDASGNVYAVDVGNARIQKFSSYGILLAKWGGPGNGDGQFNNPIGVSVDSLGNVYVADTYNYRIQKFSSSGIFLTKWGTNGIGDGQFKLPYGIAADNIGNIYVADSGNNRIQKFTNTGTFITKWGSPGTGDGQFQADIRVGVDTIGNVYVTDPNNNRIQRFTNTGTFITKWGTDGNSDGQFNKPRSVAVDASGNVFVADAEHHRIQVFGIPASVDISVLLQGSQRPESGWIVPLTVKFFTPGSDVMTATPVYTFSLTTTKSGSYATAQCIGVMPGNYDVAAVSNHTLMNVKRNVSVIAPFSSVNLGELKEGNADNNDRVNILDFGQLATSYGKTKGTAGFNAMADFDRNDSVNIFDFGLLATNYLKMSPIEVS
jgi:tripartite motif-containing protein 71